jgi:hypothetical protein
MSPGVEGMRRRQALVSRFGDRRAVRLVGGLAACVFLVAIGLLLAPPAYARDGEDERAADALAEDAADDAAGWGEADPRADNDAAGWGEADPRAADDAAGWGDAAPRAEDDSAGWDEGPSAAGGGGSRCDNASLAAVFRAMSAVRTRRLDDLPLAQARGVADGTIRRRCGNLRLVLSGHLEHDLAYQVQRAEYGAATLDAYEEVIEVREAYASYQRHGFDIAVGNQIIPWGDGEVLTAVDVINPRDVREPGMVELEDMRLPVLSSRLGLSEWPHRLELIAVHRPHFGLTPPPLGEFSPLREPLLALLPPGAPAELEWEHVNLDGQQVFARYGYRGSHVELGLYAASLSDLLGVVAPAGDLAEGALPLLHGRYQMFGLSLLRPQGDWIVRAELAADINRPYNTIAPEGGLAATHDSVLRGVAGVRYAGFKDTVVTVEYGRGEPLGGEPLFPFTIPSAAIWADRTLWRDRLSTEVLVVSFGGALPHSAFGRAKLTYKPRDAWAVSLAYALFAPSDAEPSPIAGFDRHDRLLVQLRWDALLAP